MKSAIQNIYITIIGCIKLNTICQKHKASLMKDYVMVMPQFSHNIGQSMLSNLYWMLGHDHGSSNRKILVITDDQKIRNIASNNNESAICVDYVDENDIKQIITCLSMYRPSGRIYVGMLEGLQARGSVDKLKRIGIELEEIVKNGIFNVRQVNDKGKNYCVTLFQYAIACVYSYIGEIIYKKIVSPYCDKKIKMYIYEYSGVGDVYILCSYLKKMIDSRPDIISILVVRSMACANVATMCGIANVRVITVKQMKMLLYFSRVVNFSDEEVSVITPFPRRLTTDIYSHYLYGNRINMAQAYWCVFLGLENGRFDYPIIKSNVARVDTLFKEKNLRKGSTVILSPYANTINCFPKQFWTRLVERLKDREFDICTNASDSEEAIVGTQKIWFDLQDAEFVVDTAGYFVGIRSGFCDIICGGSGRKCILYPEYEIFNSTVYDFCSFEKMGIGKNITEIRWDFGDYDSLAELVVNAIL